MSENPPPERRINRTLTQKYDMHALRILQKLELEVMQEFAEIMGCDEDDVPVDVDLLGIFNSPVNERQDKLTDAFSSLTIDTAPVIEKILKKMEELDESNSHSH